MNVTMRTIILCLSMATGPAWAADSLFVTSAQNEQGRYIRWERDRNEDGKVDERMTRDETGRTELKNDRDFDGRFEELTVQEFLKDNLSSEVVETDRDGDGKYELKLDRTYLYEQGIVVETTYEKGVAKDIRKTPIRRSR